MVLQIINYSKVVLVGVLLYVIIFALLKKIKILGDKDSVNAVIALISTIIVSTSGVATYAISYAINWFVIIFFIIFIIMVILLFIGVDIGNIAELAVDNKKILIVIFILFFSVILFRSYFALNNTFENNNNNQYHNGSYYVNTTANYGTGNLVSKDTKNSFKNRFFHLDHDTIGVVIFLLCLGLFTIMV